MKRKHSPDKHAHYTFTTVADLKQLPRDLIRPFCTDLMLWLMTPHLLADHGVKGTQVPDVFEWIHDGKHKVEINLTIHHKHKPEAL